MAGTADCILIVDHELSNCKVLAGLLHQKGYRTVTAICTDSADGVQIDACDRKSEQGQVVVLLENYCNNKT